MSDGVALALVLVTVAAGGYMVYQAEKERKRLAAKPDPSALPGTRVGVNLGVTYSKLGN